jgi:hypothetical protein
MDDDDVTTGEDDDTSTTGESWLAEQARLILLEDGS